MRFLPFPLPFSCLCAGGSRAGRSRHSDAPCEMERHFAHWCAMRESCGHAPRTAGPHCPRWKASHNFVPRRFAVSNPSLPAWCCLPVLVDCFLVVDFWCGAVPEDSPRLSPEADPVTGASPSTTWCKRDALASTNMAGSSSSLLQKAVSSRTCRRHHSHGCCSLYPGAVPERAFRRIRSMCSSLARTSAWYRITQQS